MWNFPKNDVTDKYAVPINEYIQAHRDRYESDAKKRLKRSASKDLSRNLSCLRYLKKYMKKCDKKSYLIPKLRWFLRSFRKRNAILCAILDMKVSNIDIIDTVADEKKLNMCLIQGWGYKKSLSTVPKKRKLRDWTVSTSRNATEFVLNLVGIFFRKV